MGNKRNHQPVIGIMGPGNAGQDDILKQAYRLGKEIAEKNWILLTGGRSAGVMDAASKGAFEAGGTVIGILPGNNKKGMSKYVTVPVITGMGSARNVINILSSDVVIVCDMGLGTASEASLAIKHGKPVLLTMVDDNHLKFFSSLCGKPVPVKNDVQELIQFIDDALEKNSL